MKTLILRVRKDVKSKIMYFQLDLWAMVSIYYLFAALNTAFGSLYCDEVVVTPATVVPVLAAGHLLQLVRI